VPFNNGKHICHTRPVEIQQRSPIETINQVVLLAIPRQHALHAFHRLPLLLIAEQLAGSAVDTQQVERLLGLITFHNCNHIP
jgi:hypothetical protein